MKPVAKTNLTTRAIYFLSFAFIAIVLVHALCLRTRRDNFIGENIVPSQPITAKVPTQKPGSLSNRFAGRDAALNAILLERDPQKRSIAFGRLLAQWMDKDLEGALAYVRGLPPGAQFYEGMTMLLERICRENPERAVMLAREMAGAGEPQNIYSSLFDQIARRDPTTAWHLLELAPEGQARENALRAIAGAWAASDLDATLKWAQSLSDPGSRDIALEISLTLLAQTNATLALNLAAQSLNGSALERVAASGLKQLAQNDPQAAAEAIQQLPSGDLKTQVTLDVARGLTVQQPENVLAWVQSLPESGLRQAALNNVLDLWNAQNPADASLFVAQMPPGAEQDAAAGHLGRALGESNPGDALHWAENLPSGSAQNSAVVSIVSGWAENDPAAATLWAQNLTPDNPARAEALRAAYSYWLLEDASGANAFFKTLPKTDLAEWPVSRSVNP